MSSETHHMKLGPLDHMPPRHYTRFVIYLSLKPGVSFSRAFSQLQRGLHKTFVQLPWLNGKVFWQSRKTPGWRPGQLEVRYTPIDPEGPAPAQLKYKELDSDIDFAELKELGFPADAFADEDLLWAPFAPDVEKGADVFIGQVNFIPGACLLCAAIFHSVSDGMADVSVFKLWADCCQDVETMSLPPDSADRDLLEHLWEKERSKRAPSEMDTAVNWGIVGLERPRNGSASKEKTLLETEKSTSKKVKRLRQSFKKTKDNVVFKTLVSIKGREKVVRHILSTTQPELKSRLFYISPAAFADLKRECAAAAGTLVSGNDAVCALLWRALIKARIAAQDNSSTNDTESCLEMTVDGRPYLSLPPTYLGNVVLITRATLPCSLLTSQATSLSSVSQILRQAADSCNPSSALDAYSLARSLRGYDSFDSRSTPVAGARMLITSLLTMPAASIGFGEQHGIFDNGGKAEAIRPLMGAFNKYFRICFIMPPRSFGGIEMVFNLSDAEMELLLQDDEFAKYAMHVN